MPTEKGQEALYRVELTQEEAEHFQTIAAVSAKAPFSEDAGHALALKIRDALTQQQPSVSRGDAERLEEIEERLLSDEAVREITKQIVEGSDGEVISLPYVTVRDALADFCTSGERDRESFERNERLKREGRTARDKAAGRVEAAQAIRKRLMKRADEEMDISPKAGGRRWAKAEAKAKVLREAAEIVGEFGERRG